MVEIEKELFQEELEARERFVIDQFSRAGLDIRAYPELFERFKHLHGPESKHFEDSVQIVEIIDAIWGELEKKLPFKLDKEKLILSTLLHDVGKSGPATANSEEQNLIIELFNPCHYQNVLQKGEIKQISVLCILQDSDIDPNVQQKIVEYLNKLGINVGAEKMIDFWRRHADWTFDILLQNQGGKITSEIAAIAASHHILDGKNPAHLEYENIPGEAKTMEVIESYEVLTLVDKFQAFVKRSGLSHEESVKVLEQIIDEQPLPEKVKNDYHVILKIIGGSKDKLQNILKLRL